MEDVPSWLAEAFHDPDPNVRLHALDAWARYPRPSLDPLTYALVDPDESVRARAQEIFERQLERR
jgi:HEAT repeat protein